MDPPKNTASPDELDTEHSFRKLSSDAANRKYRRPSHASGSESPPSDENPEHKRSPSPLADRDTSKASNDRRKNGGGRETEKLSANNRSIRDQERQTDGHYYRESRRHDDRNNDYKRYHHQHHHRNNRHGDEDERNYSRSSRSEKFDNLVYRGKESRDRRMETDLYVDHYRERGRDRHSYYDDRKHYNKDRVEHKEYLKGKEKEKIRNRESGEDEKEGEKRKHSQETEMETETKKERKSLFSLEQTQRESLEEKPVSSSKQAMEASDGAGSNQLDAAKAAAMKAAESVNRNIGVTGVVGPLTTDQKKRLLWGNKKSTPSEETSNRWDLNVFDDRERQEKFNKLMGVKGGSQASESRDGNQDAKKREELDMDLEKQYTAGLRRRDGRTVGLGL